MSGPNDDKNTYVFIKDKDYKDNVDIMEYVGLLEAKCIIKNKVDGYVITLFQLNNTRGLKAALDQKKIVYETFVDAAIEELYPMEYRVSREAGVWVWERTTVREFNAQFTSTPPWLLHGIPVVLGSLVVIAAFSLAMHLAL